MLIKRTSNELVEKHPNKFKKDFTENKKIVSSLTDVKSKKIRNIVAGYVTRLVKNRD